MEQVSGEGGLERLATVGPLNKEIVEQDITPFLRYAPPDATHWDYVREDDGSVQVIPNMLNSAYPTFVRICFYREF